ncbi:amidohydrolase [Gemmatimonas groenlandica]|uniref:Amidohydrolase n=1 Tax=Gemmatimonas groenlandica TaxID=2732249 RepID=A0A6M4IJM1_9BACT|nr:amidohydrolase [Gemmatimonas groenlandica]QJR34049.1 amidohydrolase [Gemmatimonas groenlandica]
MTVASLLLTNARIHTMDSQRPNGAALAAHNGRVLAVGSAREIEPYRGAGTLEIDAAGRTVIPGLIDSHIHSIRGGLNYNLELRWDGVPALADALRMLRAQAARTPPGHWVRVIGGWNEFQFAERRLPTLDEINAAAPETPVFILYLYGFALLNRAALAAVGYTRDTPDPPGGEIQRNKAGHPTGLLLAKPNASILYSTLAKGPRLSFDDQVNSSRHFNRELNRLGVTSVIDAGGGFQNYPEDYRVVEALHASGELTVRIAYNLFTQKPGGELSDFQRWAGLVRPGDGDAFYRMNGAGEMLVFSAADFENFLEPRPDLSPTLESDLEAVVRHLVAQRWPFRLHATYDESIARFLDVFERVERDVPFNGLRWWFDHAETISPRSLERTAALGGGVAIQHRMAFQGEHFVARHGAAAAEAAPPVRRMLEMGLRVGAGTDATRVASYNPWVGLYWLVSGRTVGGTAIHPRRNRLSRLEALRLFTHGSAWFSGEDADKGTLAPGMLADFAMLSSDFFSVPEDEIKRIDSLLTVVNGRVVHAAGPYAQLAPPIPPVRPDWSPVAHREDTPVGAPSGHACHGPPNAGMRRHSNHAHGGHGLGAVGFAGSGCDCFVF